LDPAIEPLVSLLEQTPRAELVERLGARVRAGLEYQDALAALLLAAACNVEPRPSVGFKFHAVLVMQSIHLATIAAPKADRWIPAFWAADYFKDAQAQNLRERGWTMAPVNESAVPPAGKARQSLTDALDHWDEPAADAAIAALARAAKPEDIWELLFRYGARDLRAIGHKAIDVANSHRVLGVIGPRHAEPVLRSLVYALLMHEDGSPAQRDDPADRSGRSNQEVARRFPANWQQGQASREGTLELMASLRDGSEEAAADQVLRLLQRNCAPRSLWDGLFLGAIELLARQPGIVSLHAVTTTNALHYAYRQAREDSTKRLLLLQSAAFLPMFRQAMSGRGQLAGLAIDRMDPLGTKASQAQAVEEIFADLDRDPTAAARKTLGYVESTKSLAPWIEEARRLILRKGRDPHDYKFGCAVLEDLAHVSEPWRKSYLAGSVFHLQGSGRPDNPLVDRIRKALKG
jgi:hypothetical protein